MNISLIDRKASKIVRSRGSKASTWPSASKIVGDFAATTASCTERHVALLKDALASASPRPGTGSGQESQRLLQLVLDLTAVGYRETASALFAARASELGALDLASISKAAPDAASIDRWLKASKNPKNAVLKEVAASPEQYFSSVVCDWFVARAPVKQLVDVALGAIQGCPRPGHLPTSTDLLKRIMLRDRAGTLATKLVGVSLDSPDSLRNLIAAMSDVPRYGDGVARAVGHAILSEAALMPPLVELLSEMVRSRQARVSEFVSLFFAHVITTICLHSKVGQPYSPDFTSQVGNFGVEAWRSASDGNLRDLWFLASAKAMHEATKRSEGQISDRGAMQIALGLRAADSGSDARDALWSTAFNLGLREIGNAGDLQSFDPLLHDDTKGGLLRGSSVRILRSGWSYHERALVRAEVAPT